MRIQQKWNNADYHRVINIDTSSDNTIKGAIYEATLSYSLAPSANGLAYINIPCAFDTETSSFYDHGTKVALTYIWQLGINGAVFYSRYIEKLQSFLDTVSYLLSLTEKKRLIIYVHNLKYDFQFIRCYIKWQIDGIFATKSRAVLYALTSNNIEFRDSLILSGGFSLAKIGKTELHKYPAEKLVGDLDYNKVRFPETPLTVSELQYCINDIIVLTNYIQEKIETDGSISNIPLTNTGYVRNYMKACCFGSTYKEQMQYHKIIQSLTLDFDTYLQMRQAFMGGFTHANVLYSNETIHQPVASYDIKSSYPETIALEYFPMSSFQLVDEINNSATIDYSVFYSYLENFCCIFDIEFYDICQVEFEDYLSLSKCKCEDPITNNGRIVRANRLATTITELDFFIIEKFYDWSSFKVTNFRIAEKGYLPRQIITGTLQLFATKTTLDGIPDKKQEYMRSKNMLNAVYGMMVTSIIHAQYSYIKDWTITLPQTIEELEKYNNSFTRFLYYPWGVWVTAHARYNLFQAIYELGSDFVYADTDSVKFINPSLHTKFFTDYNNEILSKIIQSSETNAININLFRPKTPSGVTKTIGFFEYEDTYTAFKTIGAKRYMYTTSDGNYHMTFSGVNSTKALAYFKQECLNTDKTPFDFLADSTIVPSSNTGRLTMTYIDEYRNGYFTDYLGKTYYYSTRSGIHSEPKYYNMSLSDLYLRYLNEVKEENVEK